MLDAADVLVDGHPARHDALVPCGAVVASVAVAQEVPGRVDEGVHRVRLAPRRPSAARALGVDPLLGGGQRRAALRRVVLEVRQADGQVVLGDGHDAVALAVDDRDRAAPVALAGDEPVAQAVVDGAVALALAVEPVDDALLGLAAGQPVEVGTGVDQRPVAGAGQVAAVDHAADGQVVGDGEGVVALVVRGHGHDRAGPVLHEDVVGDVHGDGLAVDGVHDGAAERAPRSSACRGRRGPRWTRRGTCSRSRGRPVAGACPPQGAGRRGALVPSRRRWRRRGCPGGW